MSKVTFYVFGTALINSWVTIKNDWVINWGKFRQMGSAFLLWGLKVVKSKT